MQHPAAEDFAPPSAPHPFDRAHGVDTGGYTPGEQLASGSPSDLFNTAYYGISPSTLRLALAALPESVDGFTFVDLGCGKGRALLVAAEFPFTHIVGVELAPELAGIARSNTQTRTRIEVLHADAATVLFPTGPLVVFLYHPFLAPVLARALHNLERQLLQGARRPMYLIRANPCYPRLMSRQWFLRPVWTRVLPLSSEDAAADRHGTTTERYELWRADL